MSNNKVHSRGNVPFSWEKKPGISKETTQTKCLVEEDFVLRPPPPPCPPPVISATLSVHDLLLPPPPGVLPRSSSAKGLGKQDEDPFLAAFKECTKSTTKGKSSHRFDLRSGIRSLFTIAAPCKSPRNCSVRNDNMVRVSQLSYGYD
ncbi:hypothetical protein L484_003758 [Morus notabilis]|uniref:Uncharacterized protein n=1 Tax=Morus notabilis TaxID=981085 RepID=W9SCA7_9ROSA|nr:hypothetical protein L484_003758 [Morus notabilis]